MFRHILSPLIVVFALSSPALAQTCSRDLQGVAAKVEAARNAVLGALPKDDLHAGEISPRASTAIAAMQARLSSLIAARMRCSAADADVKGLANELQSDGPMLVFKVRRHAPDLLAVTAQFGVGCGDDAILAVFARRDGAWREVLHLQSRPYGKVSGAWGDFRYEISPPDGSGHWFVVTKTVAPWCSSTWSEIRYAVFRPSSDPRAPKTLMQAKDPIWWGGEDFGRLSVGQSDFELRFHAESIDGGIHNREWVRHFSVLSGKAVRIAPFADTPRDFVEEWIKSEWKDAVSWTAPALAPRVRELHDRFLAEPYGEYRSIRACGTDVLQIEVRPNETDSSLYFEVAGKSDFRLTGLSNTPDPRCAGKNLYDIDKPE